MKFWLKFGCVLNSQTSSHFNVEWFEENGSTFQTQYKIGHIKHHHNITIIELNISVETMVKCLSRLTMNVSVVEAAVYLAVLFQF